MTLEVEVVCGPECDPCCKHVQGGWREGEGGRWGEGEVRESGYGDLTEAGCCAELLGGDDGCPWQHWDFPASLGVGLAACYPSPDARGAGKADWLVSLTNHDCSLHRSCDQGTPHSQMHSRNLQTRLD